MAAAINPASDDRHGLAFISKSMVCRIHRLWNPRERILLIRINPSICSITHWVLPKTSSFPWSQSCVVLHYKHSFGIPLGGIIDDFRCIFRIIDKQISAGWRTCGFHPPLSSIEILNSRPSIKRSAKPYARRILSAFPEFSYLPPPGINHTSRTYTNRGMFAVDFTIHFPFGAFSSPGTGSPAFRMNSFCLILLDNKASDIAEHPYGNFLGIQKCGR